MYRIINRLLPLLLTAHLYPLTLAAQNNFTTRLTTAKSGSGVVTLHQDPRLTDLINNGDGRAKSATSQQQETTGDNTSQPLTGRKVKMRGFRIQVYWGGSQRTDQTKASQMGTKVTYLFPELNAYTTFESPHWRCRVGDFADRQEAAEYLRKFHEKNIGADAMIVRSEIFVYK